VTGARSIRLTAASGIRVAHSAEFDPRVILSAGRRDFETWMVHDVVAIEPSASAVETAKRMREGDDE
jgi:hypothetical protein